MHIMKRDELVAIRSSMINKSLRNPIPWRSQFLTVPCYFSSKLNRGEICNKKARKTEETTRIDCTKDTIQQLTHRIQKFEKRSNDKSESDCKFWRRTYQIVHYVRAFNYCLSHFQLVFSSICLPFNKGNRNWSTVAIFFLFLLQIVIGSAFSSSNSVYPMLIIDATNQEDYDVFNGGTSTTGDSLDYDLQFQTLTFVQQWGNASNVLLVGGLSNIYMLNPTSIATSAHKLHYIERLKWKADDNDQHMCSILGKPKYECHNFIRIVQLLENNTLFVCGTNAFAPKCRYYSRGEFNSLRNAESNYYYEDQCMGSCEVPFSAGASAVFLYANTTQGFRRITALNGQFHGRTSKLLKKGEIPTISSEDPAFYGPEFIKIVSYKNGKAYLFFRETAIAVETGNRPMTYGRVAQVCLNDTGGDTVLRNEWTTFLKARLKCSIPQSGQGQEELTFDNLTSVSDIINITIDGVEFDVVMATFTTPQSWYPVSLSAICIFKMDDIIRLFDTGYFLGESHLQSTSTSMGTYDSYETYMKIPLMGSAIPSPRPGTCSQPGQVLSARNLNFIKHRFLMFEPVMAHQNEPLFVSQLKTRMTEIAVDPQAGYTDHTVVYVGTEDGRVLRIRLHYKQIDGIFEPIYLEEIRLIKEEECNSGTFSCNVRALYVFRPPPQSGEKPVLFVGFSEKLIRIPTSFCNLRHQPECCNFDPECGWKEGRCVQRIPKNGNLPEIINSRNRSLLCNTKPKNKKLSNNTEQEPSNGGNTISRSSNNAAGNSTSITVDVTKLEFNPILAGFMGAAVAIVLTLLILCLIRKRKKKKKFKPRFDSLPKSDMFPISCETEVQLTAADSYFNIETTTTKKEVAASETKTKKGNNYTPVKLVAADEKKLLKENMLEATTDTAKSCLNQVSSNFLWNSDDTAEAFESYKSATCDTDSTEEPKPPSLPPKQNTGKNLTDYANPIPNENNNSSKTFTVSRSSLPPPIPDRDESESTSRASTPPPPPSFKPPTPNIEAKDQPHQESVTCKHFIKPMVPPKSAAVVMRSVSMRASFENKRPQPFKRYSSKDDQYIGEPKNFLKEKSLKAENFFNISEVKASSNHRKPHSTLKGAISVLPPISPTS